MKRHILFLVAILPLLIFMSIQVSGRDTAATAATVVQVTHNSHPTSIEDIASLEGAVVDPGTGQLMLVGQDGSPALNLDDFLVALRVIYGGDFLAVSIDPNENDNAIMDVVYFGDIEDTHLGFVLYEADRLLKVYSLGVDNLTGQSINSTVPGYQSELALASADVRDIGQPVWHRMWFEPAQLISDSPAGASGRRGISLSGLGVTLNTEYVSIEGSPIPGEGSDPAAEQFVAHFNDNFAAFATERPVFQELVQVRRWLYLARWLRDEGIPVKTNWLLEEVTSVETPGTTPRISVSRDMGPYRLMLGGGVDFSQENDYQHDDQFADMLASTLLSKSPFERAGTIAVDGQDYTVVVLPLYETMSYPRVDADGSRWHFSIDDGLLLSMVGAQEDVTNFEYDENGQLVRKVMSYAEDAVVYERTDTGIVRLVYLTETAARLDLASQVRVQTSQTETEGATEQDLVYAHLQSEGRLLMPERNPLSVPTDGEMQVWPFFVDKEIWVAIQGTGEQIVIPSDDLFTSVGEERNLVQVARGSTAIDVYSRLLVARVSDSDVQFVFPFDTDGQLCFQVGQRVVSIPDWTLEKLDGALEEGSGANLSAALTPLLDLDDQKLVLFSGAGFSDTGLGPEHEELNRERSARLTRALIQSGKFNVHADDEAEEAVANLAAQVPLIDQAGQWHVVILLDEALPGDEVDSIVQVAKAGGIPVQTGITAPTEDENVILITDRDDEVVKSSLLPDLGANDHLQDRYLILFVVGQGQSDRSYARVAVVEFGATGVLINDGALNLLAVQETIDSMIKLRSEIQDKLAAEALLQLINLLLEQPELDDTIRQELEQMLRGSTPTISQSLRGVGVS